MKSILNFFKKCSHVFRKIEQYSLVFLLSLLIVLSFSQIIMRFFLKLIQNVFPQTASSAFIRSMINATVEIEPIIKFSVLWIALLAAGMATFEKKHIKIDLIGRFAKGRLKSIVLAITNTFAGIVSLVLSYASAMYIFKIEIYASDPPPFLNIPKWFLLIILPLGFLSIGTRFIIRAIKKIKNFIEKNEDEEEDQEELITTEYNSNKGKK